jgi:2-haloacid dehalogenase
MLGKTDLPYHLEFTYCRIHPVTAIALCFNTRNGPCFAFPRQQMAWRPTDADDKSTPLLAGGERRPRRWRRARPGLVRPGRAAADQGDRVRRLSHLRSYPQLRDWPDVKPALTQLRAAGIRLAFLNNFTPAMLEANTRHAGLGFFEFSLSVDAVRVYKPHPRAYQMGVDAFRLSPEEILFAAFAGWDAAGAKLFGYPTFWVNRQGQPAEELGAMADGTCAGMADLVRFVLARA